MVMRPPSLCSEKDSRLPRCSMIPVNISLRIAFCIENATGRRRTAGIACPTVLLAVDVLEVGLDGDVGAELLDADARQGRLSRCEHVRERNACLAAEFWGVEELEFLHQTGGKRGAVQCGAGFEQDARDFALA